MDTGMAAAALELNGEAIAPSIASVIAIADLVDFLIPLIIPHFGSEDFDFISSFALINTCKVVIYTPVQ